MTGAPENPSGITDTDETAEIASLDDGPLTAGEIRRISPSRRRRGYDRRAVDALLRNLAQSLETISSETQLLRARSVALGRAPETAAGAPEATGRPLTELAQLRVLVRRRREHIRRWLEAEASELDGAFEVARRRHGGRESKTDRPDGSRSR